MDRVVKVVLYSVLILMLILTGINALLLVKSAAGQLTPARDLTGVWTGSAEWTDTFDYYPTAVTCYFVSNFELDLNQNGNVLTGNVQYQNIILQKSNNDQACSVGLKAPVGGINDGVVSSSSFSGSLGDGALEGSFTTDLMSGTIKGTSGFGTFDLSFKAQRQSVPASPPSIPPTTPPTAPQPAPSLSQQTIDISITAGDAADQSCVAAGNCYDPDSVQISQGDTVTWTNDDTASHTVTSGHPTDNQTGTIFDSSLIKAGGTYSFTFQNAGNYHYFCQVHPWMTGEVIVGGLSGIPPQPTLATQQNDHQQMQLPTLPSDAEKFQIKTENGVTFEIGYSITGGTVNDMVPNLHTNTMDIPITADSAGSLKLYMPIPEGDSHGTNSAPSFSANVDGENIQINQGNYDGILTLEIPFQYNSKDIILIMTPPKYSSVSQTSQNGNYTNGNYQYPDNHQDITDINQAKSTQTIAAEISVGANNTETTSIDNNVSVQTSMNNPDSLDAKVSASSQTGPKVVMFNLPATSINVANLKDLGIMYDGKPIPPASSMDAILHAKPTDSPSFIIVLTQSGVQVLVLIPHFSTHTITITNMSKVIPAVPEFPFAIPILAFGIGSLVALYRLKSSAIKI